MNERAGRLLIAGVAPALAEGTDGVGLSHRTKRVTAESPRCWNRRNRVGQGVVTRGAATRRQARATTSVTATKMRARAGPNESKTQN
jgi:hypothetical protein